MLAELRRTLRSPRLRHFLIDQKDRLEVFLSEVEQRAVVVKPKAHLSVITRDPADNRVLEAGVAGKANSIITGDEDLLSLKSFENISIMRPARFLAVMTERAA
jgi:putative PIN family toxin of toxin-antitoxin system